MISYKQAGDTRAFGTVSNYIQGPGEMDCMFEHCSAYGHSPLFIITKSLYDSLSRKFEEIYREHGYSCVSIKFGGASTMAEINRLTGLGQGNGCDVLVAIGGGAALDTGKAVAVNLGVPMVMVPTTASCDAPCSRITAVYNEDGSVYPLIHKKNPDLVLVDTEIVVKAPARLLSAGIGDALATWIEAKAGFTAGAVNGINKGYKISLAGMAVAEAAYKTILLQGRQAYEAAKLGRRTQAFEDLVEANILLSGVGFENTACSIAHGFQASASGAVPEMHHCLHGEKVSYGIIVQRLMENAPMDEIDEIVDFLIDVHLPVTLEELGVTEDPEKKMRDLAHYGIENKALMHVEPFRVTEESLFEALMFADAVGRRRKEAKKLI